MVAVAGSATGSPRWAASGSAARAGAAAASSTSAGTRAAIGDRMRPVRTHRRDRIQGRATTQNDGTPSSRTRTSSTVQAVLAQRRRHALAVGAGRRRVAPAGAAHATREEPATRREQRAHPQQRGLRLAPQVGDVHGDDAVVAPAAQVGGRQRRGDDLEGAGRDVHRVPPRRRGGHRRRAVERGDVPGAREALADQRDRDAVAAADLQHAVGRLHAERVDDPGEPLA